MRRHHYEQATRKTRPDMRRPRIVFPRNLAAWFGKDRSDSDAGRVDHEHDVVPRRVPEPDYVERHEAYVRSNPEPGERVVQIELELTEYEAGLLTAAVCEQYHHFKAVYNTETYGPMIGDQRVLAARRVWLKVEDQTKVRDWTNPE